SAAGGMRDPGPPPGPGAPLSGGWNSYSSIPVMARMLHRPRPCGAPSRRILQSHAMHPAITEILTRLDLSRAELREAVDRVAADQRDQAPASGRWSVAGVLEHLALVDERFTAIIANKIAEARASGVAAEQ